MSDYLHGIKTIFMLDGDPIELLDASIIGIVGTGVGAVDADYPLNTPFIINSTTQQPSLGEGTLKRALSDIWRQTPAIAVCVRVDHDDDADQMKANIIGSLDNDTGLMTGMQALLRSEQETTKRPRIIIAPEFQDSDIAAALDSLGQKYNAIPVVETKGTGFLSHSLFTKNLNYVYPVSGGAKYFDTSLAQDYISGGSATVAGIMVKNDNDNGFQQSPSNKQAFEIKGAGIPIDYTAGSATCLANIYNSENMAVFASMKGGTKLWGARLANGKMVQKERVRMLIADTINEETQDVVDGNITKAWVDNLVERVQNFLDRMQLDGVISGGKCWVPSEINIANIGLNKFYLDYSVGYYDSAEQVVYRQYTDNTFTEKVFA